MSSDSRQPPGTSRERWMAAGVCAALVALVWIVFGQAAGFDYVNYDDAGNVAANPQVAAGLSLRGVAWAFTHSQVGRWAPFTTLSHMADWQFFGQAAGRHHLTNVALHALSAALLFLALRGMTGGFWQSAFVAVVFAVHPLRAEPVSWLSARGDLLAGAFFMLALLAYARHAQAPGSRAWYWSVAAFFAMGLMCKPTIVMLPFVLLSLDYWPLGRFTKLSGEPAWLGVPIPLIVEKIPLFLLSALSCVAAALAQQAARTPIENLSLSSRLCNAFVSCVIYAWQTIYPVGLAVFYPHPGESFESWRSVGALLLLAAVSAAVYAGRKRFPYALVGWGWYLVMLPPVLGIVEIGAQAHADRYTYLPQIGLCMLAAWGAAGLFAKWRLRAEFLGMAAGIVITALVLAARGQAATWRDSVALWTNAVENTPANVVAEDNLGTALLHKGDIGGALDHLRKALALDPARPETSLNMGNAFLKKGQTNGAIAEYQRALSIDPDSVGAHVGLGNALLESNRPDDAIAEFHRALEINPHSPEAHNNLGEAFRRTGRLDDAIAQFQTALQLAPAYQAARDNLALALRQKGEAQGVAPDFQR